MIVDGSLQVLATLVKRDGESAVASVQRMEEALDKAACGGVVTNEIEGGEFVLARSSTRGRLEAMRAGELVARCSLAN